MPRPKKHNIDRSLWNTPFSKDNKIQQGLLSTINFHYFFHTFNNASLAENEKFIMYNKIKNEVKKNLLEFQSKCDTDYEFLLEENLITDCLMPKDYERLQKKFDTLRKSIDKVHTDTKSFPSYNYVSEITTKDFFLFNKYLFNISFTSENAILNEFGRDILQIIKNTTFKDNLNDRCSNDVILLNITMILIIEKNRKRLPFSILNEGINTDIWVGYDSQVSKVKNLKTVLDNLNKLQLRSLQFSDEFMYALIFYTFLSKEYNELNSQMKRCINYYNHTNFLFKPNVIKLLSKYFKQETYIQLYKNLVEPYINKSIETNDASFFWNTKKESMKKIRNELKTSFNELIFEYIYILPDLLKEIALEEESSENTTYNNELLEDTYNFISLLENNNISRFVRLITLYNNSKINEKIILIIFNLCSIDNNIMNSFISIFESKLNYPIADFPPDNIFDTDKSLLTKFLNERRLQYQYTKLLTRIDYNSLSLKEWNFLVNLPNAINSESDWISCFYNIIVSYCGNKAFTCIKDILD